MILLARYLQLLAASRSDTATPDSAPMLATLHRALRDHAKQNLGRLPASLADINLANPAITYRPAAAPNPDEKLLIAHDAAPSRTIIEFPHSRPGRNILFLSGRVRAVSESAFEKLIEADDAFREKLGYD